MPANSGPVADRSPELYWRLRQAEVGKQLRAIDESVRECQSYQTVLTRLSETAKLHEPDWQENVAKAGSALRKARARRTTLRRTVANIRDTLRIRPHLATAFPDSLAEQVATASLLIDYLEAHGY